MSDHPSAPLDVPGVAPVGGAALAARSQTAGQVEVRIDRVVIESSRPIRAEQLEVELARELNTALRQRAGTQPVPEARSLPRLAGLAMPAASEAGTLARNLAQQLVNGVWPA